MIDWIAQIEKFDKKGEKTGWTYIFVPSDIAQKLQPDTKKSFNIKGHLDNVAINKTALIPMGGGDYILPLNAGLRRKLKKRNGDEVLIKIEMDNAVYELNTELISCLKEFTESIKYFYSLPQSHQKYFSKYVDAAKTTKTRVNRILKIVKAMELKQSYAEMIRSDKGHV